MGPEPGHVAIDADDAGGVRITGFECPVAGVGELAFVADPSGNPVGLMRYQEGSTP